MTNKQLLRVVSALAVCVLIGFAVRQTAAQLGDVSVQEVEFKATRLQKGKDLNPVTVEEGTYWIAPGRYRFDTLYVVTGERIAEIVKDDEKRRIRLDLTQKHALVGSTLSPMPPVGKGLMIEPPGARGSKPEPVDQALGEKYVDGLKLEGVVTTFDHGAGRLTTMETWYYRFSDPRVLPVVLETRFESPDEIYEKRVDRVSQTLVSPRLFEIPADFETTQPGR